MMAPGVVGIAEGLLRTGVCPTGAPKLIRHEAGAGLMLACSAYAWWPLSACTARAVRFGLSTDAHDEVQWVGA